MVNSETIPAKMIKRPPAKKNILVYVKERRILKKRKKAFEKSSFRKFWFVQLKNKSGEVELKMHHLQYIYFLRQLGFRRYDLNDLHIFIKLTDKIIQPVNINQVQDNAIKYIKNIPQDFWDIDGTKKSSILEKLHAAPAIYFSDRKLTLLGTIPNLIFNSDSLHECYIYYSNGFAACSKNGIRFFKYNSLEGYVWKDQIKLRSFKPYTDDGNFKKFIWNVSGQDEDRFLSLKTILGYLLHSFFDTKLKAVNFTDSVISETAEGRTGKTLTGRALAHMKNTTEISGKEFDSANKHKYAEVSIDTQVIFLNDVKKGLKLDVLFNDISDCITVDKKNQHPFKIRTKMLITSNATFRVEGASARDRIIEFEFADHYNDNHSPESEFGEWFFRDWSREEWLKFDNFMLGCVVDYFKHGIVEAQSINLMKNKQIQHTNPDFAEWMGEKVMNGEIKLEQEYDKKVLHNEFLEKYPEYREHRWLKSAANFTRFLKIYSKYEPSLKGFINERRSDGKSLIGFSATKKEKTENPTMIDLPF